MVVDTAGRAMWRLVSALIVGALLLEVMIGEALARNCPPRRGYPADWCNSPRSVERPERHKRAQGAPTTVRRAARTGGEHGPTRSLSTAPSTRPAPHVTSAPTAPHVTSAPTAPHARSAPPDSPRGLVPGSGSGNRPSFAPAPVSPHGGGSGPVPSARAAPTFNSPGPPASGHVAAAPAVRLPILETGFSPLTERGKEQAGYGLYSYAILVSDSGRSSAFLAELFRSTPSIKDTAAKPSQTNIFYVPLQKDKFIDFAAEARSSSGDPARLGQKFSRLFYDHKMARGLLDQICNPPAAGMQRLCQTDLSRGPYIFTYAAPATNLQSVPPPYLFVDLSDVHERAFGELLSAFREQVKRQDISDRARIDTLRLKILETVLTASDWVTPVQKAIADIVHSTGEGSGK
jgi:hypothetical protein